MHEVSIAAEKLFELAGLPVTNSLLTSIIVSFGIIFFSFFLQSNITFIPGKLQALVEIVIESMYNLAKSVSPKHADEFFPLIMTIFIFVLINNWFGLLPGLTGVGIEHEIGEVHAAEDVYGTHHEEELIAAINEADHAEEDSHHAFTPVFRAATADLNTTIALGLIAVIATHFWGIKHLGLGSHVKKFINTSSGIGMFVGILELIGEFSRIISFSFRLFGNIFAGEVLLMVIGSLVPILLPIPFIGLEIFVGFIQALVFAMLTLVFSSIAVTSHDH